MRLLQTFPLLSALAVGLIKAAYAKTVVHDGNFIPDAILRVTSGNRNQSCVPEKEILLVNGTSPGPELRLTEGKTYWIRVYNDMVDQNFTMVSSLCAISSHQLSFHLIYFIYTSQVLLCLVDLEITLRQRFGC
jgi:hypothetical protein